MTEPNEKKKREYRLGNPLTQSEYNKRFEERKTKENKSIRMFVPYELAEDFKRYCKGNGLTMQDTVTELLREFMSDKK
ncbi:RepB family protein [Candidatus Fukatsuia symbiotica]|uniref:Protein CopB n=1 Tax=Candidatus Fukatsuia symbiotica TaxID=1878942 RepID=A0A2U8I8Z3_9GAMM|nr:RepB family protein [Candidatus Fukatsuia symbiotica]AWK15587.1 hypothetical protein CCS41_14270 [Candidatus Fukatsuia symbiotica]AWK15593.1 hypothetical protein CCS41_14310 [Candidatus Fukatsuia symbiotica]MEA9446255.1 RepB family protein [Candidatus Fukatsuia symbiotica]